MMTRVLEIVLIVLFALGIAWLPQAFAGSPHFIFCTIVGTTPTSLSVAAKEAGLGDEAQIHVQLTADAQCVNPGGNEPSAENKDAVAVDAVVPVMNGKANYTLTGVADFQPECSPPMSLVFSNIAVHDLTNGLTCIP